MPIATSMIMVYFNGYGVVTNGRCRQRSSGVTNISMNVDEMWYCSLKCLYAISNYILPMIIHFLGCLRCMVAAICNIWRINNPCRRG